MENTQVIQEQTASQVLASDLSQLSEIMENSFAPLTKMSPVELSKNIVVRERAQETAALALNIIQHVNAMLARAEALNKITKTVYFQTNGIHPRIQAFKDGSAVIGADGSVTADAILDCDFLFIADHDATFDPNNVIECTGVHIVVSSDELNVPSRLGFWTGGTYRLYWGASLSMCYNLSRTTTLTLE